MYKQLWKNQSDMCHIMYLTLSRQWPWVWSIMYLTSNQRCKVHGVKCNNTTEICSISWTWNFPNSVWYNPSKICINTVVVWLIWYKSAYQIEFGKSQYMLYWVSFRIHSYRSKNNCVVSYAYNILQNSVVLNSESLEQGQQHKLNTEP